MAPGPETAEFKVKRILLVDDDSSVLQMLSRALDGYDLTVARDGHEALAVADRQGLDLLITDYLMPEMTGDELIARMRQLRPNLKALVITGHGDVLDRESPEWWRVERHLSKPFRIQALRDAVEGLLAQI
jgi:CheY-like chemotaxis protein